MILPEISVRVDLAEARKGPRRITRDIKRMQKLVPEWREVAHPYLLNHMERQFETGGAHGGKRWANYASEPKYLSFKYNVAGTLRPLRWDDSGVRERLRPSLVLASHSEHVFLPGSQLLQFGTRVPWANSIYTGGVGPFGEPFPGRNPLAMTLQQKGQLGRRILNHLSARLTDAQTTRATTTR